jgi:hypothetical protein
MRADLAATGHRRLCRTRPTSSPYLGVLRPIPRPQSWHSRQHHRLCWPTKAGRPLLARRAPLQSRRRYPGWPQAAPPAGHRSRQPALLVLPLGPLYLPHPRVVVAEPQARRSPSSSGARRRPPPCRSPAVVLAPNQRPSRFPVAPRASPSTPRPRSPEFLQAAPPLSLRTTLRSPRNF